MKLRVFEKHFHCTVKTFDGFLDLERLTGEIAFQCNEIESKRKRLAGEFAVRFKGEFSVFDIQRMLALIVRGSIILHSRSFLLSGLGFGCVGLASAQTLVSPRRLGGASYHSIHELFLEIGEDFKLRHYPEDSSCLLEHDARSFASLRLVTQAALRQLER